MAAIAHLEDQRGPAVALAMLLHPSRGRRAAGAGVEHIIRIPDSAVLLRAPRQLADASPFPIKPSAVNAL